MKTFSLIAILLATFAVTNAQSTFKFSGTIHGLDSGVASLTYSSDNQPKQVTAPVRNRRFHFTGKLQGTERIGLRFIAENAVSEIFFFAGNEQVQITVDSGYWNKAVITGSKTQKEYELYQQNTKVVDEKSEALNKAGAQLYLSGKLNDHIKDSLFAVHDQLDLEKRIIITDFVKKYPSSAVSSWAVSVYYAFEPKLNELVPAYYSLSKQNQQSIYGKSIAETIETAKKTAIGKLASDFTLNDINGNSVSLSSYRGKYLLVDFWASWCGPCRVENPNVVNAYATYRSEKFDILGLSLDNNPESWKKAIKSDRLMWTQVSDLKGWESQIVINYGIKGIPFNMLLNKDGIIIAKNLRGQALQNKLKEILE